MHSMPLLISEVIYNAANQMFEALVTIHDHAGARRYACAIAAPIDMTSVNAARGLSAQALRRHKCGHMDSTINMAAAIPLRDLRLDDVAQQQNARAA